MSKISELSDGGSLQSTDYLIAVRSGGNVKVQANGAASFTTLTASGDVNFDSGTFFVDASADVVGIGTTSPQGVLEVVDTNPVLQIRDSQTSAGSATATLRMGESGASGIENYWDIKVNGSDGALQFIDNWSGGGGTGIRMVIDDSGNAMLGTTSARNSAKFTVADGKINAGTASSVDGGITLESYYSNGSLNSWGSVASSGGGAMCYGVHPKTGSQTEFTSSTAIAINRGAFVIDSDMKWYTGASQTVAVGSDVTISEKMRLDSSGNLLVGTTGIPNGTSIYGAALGPDTNGRTVFYQASSATTANTLQAFYNPNGSVGSISTSGSATSFNTSSDARLKENIADAEDAGAKVDAIQVRQFDWKVDGSHQDYGMIAQELMIVAPEAVSVPENEDDIMGVDYSKLVPMMLKEIQSLRARVAQLEQA